MTDRTRLYEGARDPGLMRGCLLRQAQHAIDAAVDVIQVRERDLDAAPLAELVLAIVALARGSRTRVVVNDRLDVALACGAGGVHLRSDSVPPAAARALAPAGFLIGRSVHGVEDARLHAAHADYLVAGTVWATPSKAPDHPLLGVEGLRNVADAVAPVPVLGIGGVTLDRMEAIAAAGAAGVAAIGLFTGGDEDLSADGCRSVPLDALAAAARARFGAPSAGTWQWHR